MEKINLDFCEIFPEHIRYINQFNSLEEIVKEYSDLERKGFEYHEIDDNFAYIKTPSGIGYELDYLKKFIKKGYVEIGNLKHIEIISAHEYNILGWYLMLENSIPFIEQSYENDDQLNLFDFE